MSVRVLRPRWVAALSIVAVLVAVRCAADSDEAWLVRAELPDGIRPLLAVVLDTSAASAQPVPSLAPYDASQDYGTALPAESRCSAGRVYWRRGAGPAPDCARQVGLSLPSTAGLDGLRCAAARASLERTGYFVASRAAQWRADGRHWAAPDAQLPDAVECRGDRGLDGSAPGSWYAADGAEGPWSPRAEAEIAWDRPPLAEPYIFYTGNFLNYLQVRPEGPPLPVLSVAARNLAAAFGAADELEAAIVRTDDDGPGGFVLRAPVAGTVAAADLEALAATAPVGVPQFEGALQETLAWLAGDAVQSGHDPRADASAMDGAGHYVSPFTHACRPLSIVATTGNAIAGCDADCQATLAARFTSMDHREELPGHQATAFHWVDAAHLSDPLTYANLVAEGFAHDAAVAAAPQLSAGAVIPASGDETAPSIAYGLTAPIPRARWPGNLFRYGLRAPQSPLAPPSLVDRDGEPAIDPATGLPWPHTRSHWSDAPDADLLAGGAAGRLPVPDRRRVQREGAENRLLAEANAMAPMADGDDAIAWLLAERTLGDPGRHSPTVVEYEAGARQRVLAGTHDGLLHAFDAASGVEEWAWMPAPMLARLPELARNGATTARDHGIDGALVLHRLDLGDDGRIDRGAGEHLWLLFGLGRGGPHYYVLDLASADDPVKLWTTQLPGRVQATAEPVVTRLSIAGSGQSAGDWVVLLSGGYDERFDSAGATGGGAGAGLHIHDAFTGRRLWSAGADDASDLVMAGLASVPSAPRAIDLDGDGHLDRAYLLDVTGNLWRIDFESGRAARELAAARPLARLGGNGRRFHATPDASLVHLEGKDVVAVAAGSGWLSRPRDTRVEDRVYVVFDGDLEAGGVLEEGDLHDATGGTPLPAGARGWYVRLGERGAGEKVIGPTVTFDHVLRFQTYRPLDADPDAPCGPPQGVVRLHAHDVRTGLRHVVIRDGEEEDPAEPPASGLPADLRFGFPDRWLDACAACRPRPFGIAGPALFDTGYAGDPVKTSWRKLPPPPASP